MNVTMTPILNPLTIRQPRRLASPDGVRPDVFEAACGADGDFGDATQYAVKVCGAAWYGWPPAYECTRKPGHAGHHVAVDVDGREAFRW